MRVWDIQIEPHPEGVVMQLRADDTVPGGRQHSRTFRFLLTPDVVQKLLAGLERDERAWARLMEAVEGTTHP